MHAHMQAKKAEIQSVRERGEKESEGRRKEGGDKTE